MILGLLLIQRELFKSKPEIALSSNLTLVWSFQICVGKRDDGEVFVKLSSGKKRGLVPADSIEEIWTLFVDVHPSSSSTSSWVFLIFSPALHPPSGELEASSFKLNRKYALLQTSGMLIFARLQAFDEAMQSPNFYKMNFYSIFKCCFLHVSVESQQWCFDKGLKKALDVSLQAWEETESCHGKIMLVCQYPVFFLPRMNLICVNSL